MSAPRTRGVLNVANAAVTGVSLIVLFRLSVEMESVAAVGLWALLQGLFLVSRIAGCGLGANITRHVAVLQRDGLQLPVGSLIAAGMLIGVLPVLVISAAAYYPISEFVHGQYSEQFTATEVEGLATLCLLAGVLSAAAVVLLAVSEGMGRLAENSLILIGANLVTLAAAFPLVHTFGLAGIGLTYVLNSTAQLLGAAVWLIRLTTPHLGRGGSVGAQLRELTGDSVQLTSVGVLRLTFEPVTKTLLAAVGSLAAVAAFELALRVSTQARVFFQSGVQPLLVHAARQDRELSPEMAETFHRGQRALSHICALALVSMACGSAAVSFVGLGHADRDFLVFFGILAGANMVNSVGLMGYYYQLSARGLWSLVRIHALMASVNLAAGVAGALAFDAIGVVSAYACTIALGGVLLVRALPQAVRSGVRDTYRVWWTAIAASSAVLWAVAAAPAAAQGAVAAGLVLLAAVPMALAYRLIR